MQTRSFLRLAFVSVVVLGALAGACQLAYDFDRSLIKTPDASPDAESDAAEETPPEETPPEETPDASDAGEDAADAADVVEAG